MNPHVLTERSARERLERVLFLAIGIGAVIFGGLLAGGGGGIVAQHSQLVPSYAVAVLTVAVVIPTTFVITAYVLPLRALRTMAGVIPLMFVALQLLWVPAMTGDSLHDDATPWLQGINALHSAIIALRWQRRWVWVFPLAQGPLVAVNQIFARDGELMPAVLDGLGAMLFCMILMGVAIAVLGAADRQDVAGERARYQASLEASQRTRDREQSRINAFVHDDIMSVLLAASRDSGADQLARQARSSLESIELLADAETVSREYSPEEAVAVFRGAVTDLAPGVAFSFDMVGTAIVEADVVVAVSEALAEAMRNSLVHAGDAERSVDVMVTDQGLTVVVRDRGRGFSMRAVSERRLGIRVSIIERMRTLDGGGATVVSRIGRGTKVTLTWRRR